MPCRIRTARISCRPAGPFCRQTLPRSSMSCNEWQLVGRADAVPTLIMTNFEKSIDGSVKAKTMTFLEKLCEDDRVPGLHIEPIKGAVDPRVRTGRVDQFWRAIVFRV